MAGAVPGLAPLLHTAATVGWTSFPVHPSTVIGLGAFAGLYEWAARRQRVALGVSRRAAFYGGAVVMFFALNGWLHELSDFYLFSAHMVQHLALALIVAPLFIVGTPGALLRPALRWPVVAPLARWLTAPVRCFAIFNVAIATLHVPPIYNAAMAHHGLHIVQHLVLMAASVLLWWPVLSPLPELPRLSYPGQMLYLFLMTIPMSIISVYIVYADGLLYPAYASAPRIWRIAPMADQMMGGLIMWIPGGLFFFAVISVVFFRWQQRGDDTRVGAQALSS